MRNNKYILPTQFKMERLQEVPQMTIQLSSSLHLWLLSIMLTKASCRKIRH